MNTSVVGRHIELTDPIKQYINDSIDVFKKYDLDIISVNAIISQETKNAKQNFTFEFTVNLPHKETIVVKQKDKDLYAAIDIATDRVSKVLRRHHDKSHDHKATKITNIDIAQTEDLIAKELERLDHEIIPFALNSYKPLDIEDALTELKNSNDIFKVFYDKDQNMRVIFRLQDNPSQYGLY